jgi:hypothetical protein
MPKLFQRFQKSPPPSPLLPYKNKSKSSSYPLISQTQKGKEGKVGIGIEVIFAPIGDNYCVRELDLNRKPRSLRASRASCTSALNRCDSHIRSLLPLRNPVKSGKFKVLPTQGKQVLNHGGRNPFAPAFCL